ncbi:MAG: hypothetical protein Q9220_004728 [cf. Caloplaca sp. 1 TL-2023]
MPSFFYHIVIDLDFQSQHNGVDLHEPLSSKISHPFRAEEPVTNNQALDASNVASHFPKLLQGEPNSPLGTNKLLTGGIPTDWRYNKIAFQTVEMTPTSTRKKEGGHGENKSHVARSITAGYGGLATKGRFEPMAHDEIEAGWGLIRLFRDAKETPGLYDETVPNRTQGGRGFPRDRGDDRHHIQDEDCTTLCILAVPSYLTPSDFLGFVGERTRDEVSHFRMIRTEKGNRYMVLMKFRDGKKARAWRKEWNGKSFDSLEPENCHVVFVKSIEFRMPDPATQESFPDMSNDPFTPLITTAESPPSVTIPSSTTASSSGPRTSKPIAPPTPSLIELPTCPVCLERMDESTGLLTILCQHVFHCSCLQKWRGSGCPVCRYTQDDLGRRSTVTSEETGLNECTTCRSDSNLWICLICGSVGCGRYDAAHAFLHYQQTSHCFAMDLSTQRVWDYASDAYVHRLVQDKADGKLMELPASALDTHEATNGGDAWDQEDYVPREKLDNIGLEYTHLLTSQLESQRTYFAEALERAADKASQAAQVAESAKATASAAQEQLAALRSSHETIIKETIPALERDNDRSSQRATRFETMARKLEKEWREEKAVSGSLMERIGWLEGQVQTLTSEKAELQELNRDMSFFISGAEKLKTIEGVNEDELREGSTSVPVPPVPGKGKKKGRK